MAAGNKKHATHEPFSRLPHRIQFSPAFRSLSASARALLLDIIAMDRGNNNGDLLITYATLATAPFGWTSNGVLRRALDELVASGLLVITADARQRVAARYALSWLPIMKNKDGYKSKENPKFLRTGIRTTNGFSEPDSGSQLDRNPVHNWTGIRTAKPKTGPESGSQEGVFGVLAVRNPVQSAICHVQGEKDGGGWAPGDGPPMTVFVSESAGAFSLSVRPAIQVAATILCTDADATTALEATRRALAIATQQNASLRLVGTTEALAAFKPVLAAVKASIPSVSIEG